MTKIALGTFIATHGEANSVIVGKPLTNEENPSRDDYGFFTWPYRGKENPSRDGYSFLAWPYWYTITASTEREGSYFLTCIGKSSLSIKFMAEEEEDIINDLASVLKKELNSANAKAYRIGIPLSTASLIQPYRLSRPGGIGANGLPEEGTYIGLMGYLYSVGHGSKLKKIGVLRAKTVDPSEFVKDLARLAGVVAITQESIKTVNTNEDFDAMYARMSEKQKEQFMAEGLRVFGTRDNPK